MTKSSDCVNVIAFVMHLPQPPVLGQGIISIDHCNQFVSYTDIRFVAPLRDCRTLYNLFSMNFNFEAAEFHAVCCWHSPRYVEYYRLCNEYSIRMLFPNSGKLILPPPPCSSSLLPCCLAAKNRTIDNAQM